MQIKAHTQSPLSPQAGEQTRPRASERVYTNSLEEEKAITTQGIKETKFVEQKQ